MAIDELTSSYRLESGSKTTDDKLKTLFKYLKEATGRTEDITESLEVENGEKALREVTRQLEMLLCSLDSNVNVHFKVHLQGDAADCLVRILRKISPRASEVSVKPLRRRCFAGEPPQSRDV